MYLHHFEILRHRTEPTGLPLVTFALAALALIGIVTVYRRSSKLRLRAGVDEHSFARLLGDDFFDTELARATFRYLRRECNICFPILPSDVLSRDLGLDSADLRSVVVGLLSETGREYLPGVIDTRLVTVEDLVAYVQASPKLLYMAA